MCFGWLPIICECSSFSFLFFGNFLLFIWSFFLFGFFSFCFLFNFFGFCFLFYLFLHFFLFFFSCFFLFCLHFHLFTLFNFFSPFVFFFCFNFHLFTSFTFLFFPLLPSFPLRIPLLLLPFILFLFNLLERLLPHLAQIIQHYFRDFFTSFQRLSSKHKSLHVAENRITEAAYCLKFSFCFSSPGGF